MSNLLVVNVDHPDAALRALGARPLPHVIVENTRNGHAHAVWALRSPWNPHRVRPSAVRSPTRPL